MFEIRIIGKMGFKFFWYRYNIFFVPVLLRKLSKSSDVRLTNVYDTASLNILVDIAVASKSYPVSTQC